MLFHQAGRDEIVDAALQPCRGDVGVDELIVDLAAAGHRQHLRRQIDPVEPDDASGPQPGAGSAGPASEIGRALDQTPRDRLKRLEQDEVHLVLHRRLVRRKPLAVALAHGHGRIAAPVEVGELEHDQGL